METRKYTQFGTLSVIVMGSCLIIFIVMMIISGFNDLALIGILSFIALIMIICLLIFYKLTIYIDDNYIQFKLGIGLIAKKYLISEIQSCKSVRNNPLYGIGIRKIPKGWLYNVSGLSAIELTFKNQKTNIRIGSNQPDEIAEVISRMIIPDHSESSSEYKDKTGYTLTMIITIMVFFFITLLIMAGLRETVVITTRSDIRIKGIFGLTINYSDIIQLDTISKLPGIRLRTNGFAFAKNLKGNFRLQDQENAKLFIKAGIPPYILIRTKDLNIYLNSKDPEKTVALFKTMATNRGQ
jgi:hypothetical protein